MPRFKTRLRDRWRPVVGETSDMPYWYRHRTGLVRPTQKQIASKATVKSLSRRKVPKRDAFLWQILWTAMEENDLGEWMPQYQRRGTCVGQAWKLGCDTAMALAYVLFNKEFPGRASVATIYAGSRVEVAGRSGRWDGSNGYWAAEYVTDWGITTLKELGLQEDSRTEDERLAIRWTGSRDGVPASFEDMAEERPVLMTPRVTTIDEALLALDSGSPISIASNLIPTGRVDRNGVSPVRRNGGHNTLVWGVKWIKDDPFFLYQNSWNGWGIQTDKGQPAGSVWISAGDLKSTLNQNDSHAIVGVGGLEPLNYLKGQQ